mmetsp:Transcript_4699/g.13721  ORF Transcript_4699/g.13721 Transcript_4699/m.13721 type:complete len:709 (-) Transcript_4699:119-2245(-)
MYTDTGKVGLFTASQWQAPAYQQPMAGGATSRGPREPAMSVHDPATGACVAMRANAPQALTIRDPKFKGEVPQPEPMPTLTPTQKQMVAAQAAAQQTSAPAFKHCARDRFENMRAIVSRAQQKLARKRGLVMDPVPTAFNALNLDVVQNSIGRVAGAPQNSVISIAARFAAMEFSIPSKKTEKEAADTPSTVASTTDMSSNFGLTSGSDNESASSSKSSQPTPTVAAKEPKEPATPEAAPEASPKTEELGDFFTVKSKKKLRRQSTEGSTAEAEDKTLPAPPVQAKPVAQPAEEPSQEPSQEPTLAKTSAPWKARSVLKRQESEAATEADSEVAESGGFERGVSFNRRVSFESEASSPPIQEKAPARPPGNNTFRRACTEPLLEEEAPARKDIFQRASTLEIDTMSKPSASAWRPMKRAQTPVSRPEALRRQVNSLLNKICPENLATICDRIREVDVNSPEELEIVMGAIFKKSLADPHYSEAYADLVASLKEVFPEFPGKDGEKPVTFKSSLLNICQAEFESLPTTLEPTAEEREQCHQEELDFQAKKKKDQMLAMMKFIGTLFLRKLVASKVLGSVMQDLLKCDQLESYPEEHAIECVCELLYSVGLSLEKTEIGKHMATCICGRLLELSHAKVAGKLVFSKRVQFAIQELLQTRAAGWARKTFKSIAQTKEAVRRQQERDEAAKASGKDVTGATFTFAGLAPQDA